MKTFKILLGIVMLFGLTACNTSSNDEDKEANTQVSEGTNYGKALVVYFSMPETDSAEDMTQDEKNSAVVVDGQVLGNTQYAAMLIQEMTGADIYRIEPEVPYDLEHQTLVDTASQEQEENARPAILNKIENIDSYDTIFIGYPIWWSDFPMILYTFFDTYDLSKKNIIPFSTHGGSGLVDTVNTIKQLEPNANVYDNALSISRNDIDNASTKVNEWLVELGFLKK